MSSSAARRPATPRRSHVARTALAAGVLALAAPAGAHAAWQPLAANDTVDGSQAALTVAPSGLVGLTFGQYGAQTGVIEHRAGAWAAPFAFPAGLPTAPVLVYGHSDSAAAWGVGADGTWGISTRTASGSWSSWSPIGPGGGAPQLELKVTIDRDDRVIAVWREKVPGQNEVGVLTSSRPVAGGAWSAPVRIGTVETGGYEDDPATQTRVYTGQIENPTVGPDGSVLVQWNSGANVVNGRGGGRSIFATGSRLAVRRPDGAWAPQPRFSATVDGPDDGYPALGDFSANDLQLDGSGTVWAFAPRGRTADDGAQEEATEVLRLDPGKTTFARTGLIPVSDEPYPVDRNWGVTVLDDGRMIASRRVATPGSAYGTTRVVVRTSTDGRTWTPARTISPDGVTVDRVTTDVNRSQGVVTFGFQTGAPDTDEYNRNTPTSVSARDWYPWDDSFSQVFEVPDAQDLSDIQIDDRADSVFRVNYRHAGPKFVVDDASGPDIDGVTAPVTLKPKAQGTFAVRATDQFSSLGTYRWDFGDGKTGKGATVKHAFAKAGTKTVSVTVTDRWGNATATSVVVTVKAGAGTPVKAAAPVGGRVRASRVALGSGRLRLHASGAAHLLVTLQRRTGTAKKPSYAPGPVIRIQPRGAGDIVARVKGLRHGTTYRVRVRADAGSARDVRRLGVNVRAAR